MSNRLALIGPAALLLSGCAFTDKYADRAKTYNTESESFYNQVILLNIMRASERMPLQFTDVQTMTGLTTSSASLGFTSPVGGFPAATTRVLSSGVGGGTQTTFTAAVLNSQDFYQGVSSPISAVEASYFVRTVRPSELIFSMLFDRVTIYRDNDDCKGKTKRYLLGCSLAFRNNPRDRQNFELFQATAEYLIRLGFSMESVRVKNREVKWEWDGKSTSKATSDTERDENARDLARYCFRPHLKEVFSLITDDHFICGRELALDFFKRTKDETDQSPTVVLNKDILGVYSELLTDSLETSGARPRDPEDDPIKIRDTLHNFAGKPVRVELTQRSTIDIFNFLGSVVAAEREFGPGAALIHSGVQSDVAGLPCRSVGQPDCDPLFTLVPDATDGIMAVEYGGRTLHVSGNRKASGYTGYALAILKQILGLNTSSKNVPTPAIITGIPPI